MEQLNENDLDLLAQERESLLDRTDELGRGDADITKEQMAEKMAKIQLLPPVENGLKWPE